MVPFLKLESAMSWQMLTALVCGVLGLVLALFTYYTSGISKTLNPGEWQQWPLDHRENVSSFMEAQTYIRMMRVQIVIMKIACVILIVAALVLPFVK